MSWLNLNQSLNSLKGQITNFASEVLSEGGPEDPSQDLPQQDSSDTELQEKCRNQELEIAALKKLTNELEATLQSERLARKNGVKEEESSWYWDPPASAAQSKHMVDENFYKKQIQALQEEVSHMKVRESRFIRPEIEDELLRLREENKNLTGNLDDLDNQHQLAMERLLSLKKELQKNFEVLKQEHEDLKNSNDEYAVENRHLLLKIGDRDEEIQSLKVHKTDYETLHHKYLNLEKIHSLLRENAEKFQEENQDLHEEIFKLQEQIAKLEHEIELSTKHSEMSNMVPRETYEELMKELSEMKHARNSNKIQLDDANIDDNAKSVIEKLKRDISELKHKLSLKEEQINTKVVKPDKIMHLYNKYINFELPVDYIGEMPSSEDNVVLFKLETVFKTLNSYKKDIDILEQKLSEKNHTVNHLQTQIDDLQTENDFLTSDIQHLESELREMKKNNDFLITEIATLKNTSKLQPIIETHEDNLAKLENELADSNKLNKSFEFEINRIESELLEVKSEKILLQDSLNDLKQKYTIMLKELETCKSRTLAVEELENTANKENMEKLQEATDEILDLKKHLHLANSENEKLSIDLHIIENDKVLLIKQIDDLKQDIKQKESAHLELQAVNSTLSEKLLNLQYRVEEINKNKEVIANKELVKSTSIPETHTKPPEVTDEGKHEFLKVLNEKAKLLEELDHCKKDNASLAKSLEDNKKEMDSLKRSHQDLLNECNNLKKLNQSEGANISDLENTIEELKVKIVQQEVSNNEITFLKDENRKILERKLQLEAELTATDNKITNFEEEFEKLVVDLNEKDTLIDSLNKTVVKNNVQLTELNQNVSDLGNTIEIKNIELQNLSKALEDITETHRDSTERAAKVYDELKNIQTDKEDLTKQIFNLNEQLDLKNLEISDLTKRYKDVSEQQQVSSSTHKALIESKDKEIKELKQSIVELTDKIKAFDNVTPQNDEYANIAKEKAIIEKEVNELRNNVTVKENELLETKSNLEKSENTLHEYKNILDNATKEKTELINLINLKHNESIQYHNEIQRLNHVLLEQANDYKKVIEDKDNLLQNQSQSCANCENLRITLKEKDEIIMSLNSNFSDYELIKTELSKANESVKNLTERCENLERNVATHLESIKKLTAENVQLSEQQNSTKELERLRHHLVELEENYTQELMTSEQKLTECQTRLHTVEERSKQNSTVYTSNSIRANQEVETLRNQLRLHEKQREEIQARLSEAEDLASRSEAALTNLQVVLEQFQLEKERDIATATEKIRNKMEDLKRDNGGLQDEIHKLNIKLEEAQQGLQAARRLGDQVETKTAQINDLKEQVRTLQTSVTAAEERYYNAISNQQDKVDKNLVKNLVVNYVTAVAQNNVNRTQVLRILSTILDFNQQECEKLGLAKSANPTDSLAAEFVKFLQNESKPRTPLPTMMGLAQTNSGSRSTTPVSRKSSTVGSHPPSTQLSIDPTGHTRNPSSGSSNLLLQNIERMETSSQISIESDKEPRNVTVGLDTGVNQLRNTEGAILKHVLRDM